MKIGRIIMLSLLTFVFCLPQVFASSVTIKGSTTVLPIAQACAEAFMNQNADVNISVQGGGSGVGIASIIDGTADIGDASRPIKDKELQKAVARGVDPKAHVVAMDGIAVVVHPSNPINALTIKQIKDIYTGKISNWAELGAGSGEIVVISRDSASGTYETFYKLALDKAKTRPDSLLQASNQAVATTVARTPGAIGYVGLGYLSDALKAVDINGVTPSKATVLSGEYSLSRPLFMYTDGKPKGAVKEFLDFVLSDRGQKLAGEAGYIGLK
ncbi:MAG: phosphate ABC transporter substrate-binding protein PstS family protein [Candidatus Omnitrophica bacterium]|nr:phosphate ABC transporter substrate-binding protein PstS family protein [Candidatus Omnitrophota bacterium]MBD3269770.1 phosphate ABC transporter substrate-binding protein PstS family protein [Candidatus Omnitrophota bacterium]